MFSKNKLKNSIQFPDIVKLVYSDIQGGLSNTEILDKNSGENNREEYLEIIEAVKECPLVYKSYHTYQLLKFGLWLKFINSLLYTLFYVSAWMSYGGFYSIFLTIVSFILLSTALVLFYVERGESFLIIAMMYFAEFALFLEYYAFSVNFYFPMVLYSLKGILIFLLYVFHGIVLLVSVGLSRDANGVRLKANNIVVNEILA